MALQTFLTLPSGQKMPALGLGTCDARDEDELAIALDAALEDGYRHIDTAFFYENEAIIGKVLKKWLEAGKIKRNDLFITTKLPSIGVHPDRVELFIKKSLANLQLDYVDLYLVHTPIGFKYEEGVVRPTKLVPEGKTDHAGVWKKMEEQVDAGRAKNIGLSNYNISQIETVLKTARIKPANLQVELNVFLQQRQLVDFCHKHGITVVAYCPLGSPNFNSRLTTRYGQKAKQLPNILGNPVIGKIAKKHSKTPAQVALKYLLQIGLSTVPKSVTPKRIKENIEIFDFDISDEDMKDLTGLEVGESARIVDLYKAWGFSDHPDYPYVR